MTGETFITGCGEHLHRVHARSKDCDEYGCVIHNPTHHCMDDLPTHWRADRGLMERICPHGVGHPDPDDLAFKLRIDPNSSYEGVHGCDGCCSEVARKERDLENDADPDMNLKLNDALRTLESFKTKKVRHEMLFKAWKKSAWNVSSEHTAQDLFNDMKKLVDLGLVREIPRKSFSTPYRWERI